MKTAKPMKRQQIISIIKIANIVVKHAIVDDNIPSVGGQIYTVGLDKDVHTKTYIDGKAIRW